MKFINRKNVIVCLMLNCGCEIDFSDEVPFFDEGMSEVKEVMKSVGEESVQYAKDNGDYKDHTKVLRNSNRHEVDESGLTLKNEADYASFVESKGFEVLTGAALHAEKRLREEIA